MMLIIRYLSAALVASLSFVLVSSVSTLWAIYKGVATYAALTSEMSFAPTYLAITLVVVIPLGVPFALAASQLARSFQKDGYAYWVGAAGGAAAIASALFIRFVDVSFPGPSNFAAEWWRLAQLAIPSAAAGGFVFKWLSTLPAFSGSTSARY